MEDTTWIIIGFCSVALLFIAVAGILRLRDQSGGAVLLRLYPAGYKLLSLLCSVCIILGGTGWAVWAQGKAPLNTRANDLVWEAGFVLAMLLLLAVFNGLPIRICESGITDSGGFVPWSAVERCEWKRSGSVVLYLFDVMPGCPFKKKRLDCRTNCVEPLKMILAEHLDRSQPSQSL